MADVPTTEPKVTAATVGAGAAGLATAAVIWVAQRYLGLELTEVQAAAVVAAAATLFARITGRWKSSPTSAVSDGFDPAVARAAVAARTEKTYASGEAGQIAASELCLIALAVMVLLGLLFGWGLAN